jgi:6-phosphogluconate dehydrogenase
MIVDRAGQKGTGRWTVIEALKMGQSANTIEAAIGARGWSSEKPVRELAQHVLDAGAQDFVVPEDADLENALLAARIIAHAQGFRVLAAASGEFDWSLDMARFCEIWRAGCIIRSVLMDDFATAFRAQVPMGHLVLSPKIVQRLGAAIPALRRVVAAGALGGVALPAFGAALAWYDSMRRARGTTNLIQAQCDFFGVHGFERVDQEGKFHADWPALPDNA